MPTTVFRSRKSSLRIGLPPEQFDYDVNKLGKKVHYQASKFVNGVFETSNKNVIEYMRNHPGNQSKGGMLFWEENRKISANVSALQGKPTVGDERKSFSPEEITIVKAFFDIVNKPIDLEKKISAIHTINMIMDIFEIVGIERPKEEHRIRTLKSIATEILDLLEDNDLLTEEDLNSKVSRAREKDSGRVKAIA